MVHAERRFMLELSRLNRGTFLAGAAALGCASITGAAGAQVPAPPSSHSRIDVHHHYVPPKYLSAVGTASLAQPILTWTPAKSLEDMEAGGVSRALLSITTPGLDFGMPAATARLARDCNEYAAGMMQQYPTRFGMFAALPLPDVKASLIETAYALDVLKADGVGLFSSYAGHIWLGSPELDPLFAELDRRHALVFVHPTSNACCTGLLPNVFDSIIEYQTDSTRAIANYVFNGAAKRFPNVKVIFSHAGGTMPFLIGRFLEAARSPNVSANVAAGVNAMLASFYYDTAQSVNPQNMKMLASIVPTSHIMFGTDFPFGSTPRQAAGLQTCGFSDADLRAIFTSNAMALLAQHAG
jgi:predicted TIM-barrel fold metal-dependent hydrolase